VSGDPACPVAIAGLLPFAQNPLMMNSAAAQLASLESEATLRITVPFTP
jgi:hypothetical protein